MIGHVYTLGGKLWRVLARGAPFDKGPRRNVLVERVVMCADGEYRSAIVRDGSPDLLVRPFRGLRRA